jgi:predicted acetyltransferase
VLTIAMGPIVPVEASLATSRPSNMNVLAIKPSIEYAAAFVAMLDEFDAIDPHNTEFYSPARADFRAYVQSLKDEEAGANLPPGFVPCTHRWLVTSDGEVVGVSRLRHSISTPFLAQHGGHIGYDVAPSRRGNGYGHFALAVALREARRIGLDRVLIYAAEGNAPSRATVKRAGGVLDSVNYSEFWNEPLCKYWVTLAAES